MSFQSTGGTGDVAADDTRALGRQGVSNGNFIQAGATFFVTGLSPGSHTFTAKYRDTINGSTATIENRSITVIPMP
jgi:hypothetical protein